mgnify:CR=1 FL=1
MDYILLALIIIGTITNFFFSKYFANKISSNQSKLLESYRKELLTFSITQKQNSEKLVGLLNRLFVSTDTVDKPTPNTVAESDPDEIEFAEENFMSLPKDVKFEVEGGDSSIPPGFTQQTN